MRVCVVLAVLLVSVTGCGGGEDAAPAGGAPASATGQAPSLAYINDPQGGQDFWSGNFAPILMDTANACRDRVKDHFHFGNVLFWDERVEYLNPSYSAEGKAMKGPYGADRSVISFRCVVPEGGRGVLESITTDGVTETYPNP